MQWNQSWPLTFPKNPAPLFSLRGDVGAEMVLLVCPGGASPPTEPGVFRLRAAPSGLASVRRPPLVLSDSSPPLWYLKIIISISTFVTAKKRDSTTRSQNVHAFLGAGCQRRWIHRCEWCVSGTATWPSPCSDLSCGQAINDFDKTSSNSLIACPQL